MSELYTLHRGRTPLVVSAPHCGTWIPDELAGRYTERALGVEDTDWFVDRLYAFAVELGASLITPRASRYVIDLNRPSDNRPMYAGRNNTELCPTRNFAGEPIYRAGAEPDAAEVAARVARARDIQSERYAALGLPHVRTNAQVQGPVLEDVARPDTAGLSLLRDAADAMRLSARGYHPVLRVARTPADLDGADAVGRPHTAEALSYRAPHDRLRSAA